MQIVLVLEQRRDLVLVAGRNQPRRRKCLLQILDDVVALDVHRAVMHQHRHEPARIDAEKPRPEVLVAGQIDRMRLPRDALEVEEDAELLRARRAGEVQHVHALPAQHLASLDVAVDELNHDASRLFRAHHRRRGRCECLVRGPDSSGSPQSTMNTMRRVPGSKWATCQINSSTSSRPPARRSGRAGPDAARFGGFSGRSWGSSARPQVVVGNGPAHCNRVVLFCKCSCRP